jgi:uncharacterized membrane protein YkvA (DUF1232 family)
MAPPPSASTGATAGRAVAAAAALLERRAEIVAHLARVRGGRLRRLARRVRFALECLRDVVRGRYRQVPWATVAALTFAVAYFLAPLDAVPDVIPLSGFLDDAGVLWLVFQGAERDLRAYCAWRGLDPADIFG